MYCTSQLLLEAHLCGRKHQRRMAGLESPDRGSPRGGGGGLGPGAMQALVTPFYCPPCGLYATSKEQLAVHQLGKRHARMAALARARMGLPPDAGEGGGGEEGGAAGAHVYRCDLCSIVTPSRRHYEYHLQVGGWVGGSVRRTGG